MTTSTRRPGSEGDEEPNETPRRSGLLFHGHGKLLDGAARSPFGLIARIEDGLPFGSLERVARLIAPSDAQFKYRLIPKATYERRKTADRLSSDEGARVARIWSLALDVWQDEDEAREFLFRPHPMLEDRRPIEVVIHSEIGSELVLDVLGRLKCGTAA